MSLQPHMPQDSQVQGARAGRSIPNCLYQYSTHEAYTGGATLHGPQVSSLTSYGDYAFCLTPNNQPIAMIDSQYYSFDENHEAHVPPSETRLAFAMICLLTPENRVVSKGGDTIHTLRETFGKGKFEYDGSNNPVPFAVRGAFSKVTTTKGEMKNIQGTIFGFAIPRWMEGLSGVGVRCCFRSGCHSKGGEVVDFSTVSGTYVEWAISDHLRLGLPLDAKFETMKLPLEPKTSMEIKKEAE